MPDKRLSEITEDDITAAHLAIEDELIDMRDHRIGVLGYANGMVVNERDGSPSSIMRLGTREAIKLALKAIAERDA